MTRNAIAGVILCLALVAGAGVRLNNLDVKTIRQGETYVPGLDLPAGVSDPAPRKTLLATLTGSMWDVHPPTWYLEMWFWTKAFGTSLYSIRFPSVLFGVVVIGLTFAVARLEADRSVAALAATLVAFNGHQILWSQIARQYTLAAALGLSATMCLLLATGRTSRGRVWAGLYVVSTVWGLVSLYYYWILLASQTIWILLADRFDGKSRAAFVRLQLLAVIVASPVLAIAAFQAKESYLGNDLLGFAAEYVQFGFMFEEDAQVPEMLTRGARSVVLLGSLLLLAAGLWRLSRGREPSAAAVGEDLAPPFKYAVVACLAAVVAIAGEAFVFSGYQPEKTTAMVATAAVPILTLAIYRWPVVGFLRTRSSPSLAATLTIAPIVLVSAISLFVPFLASKAMLLFTPYLLIVLGAGIRALSGTNLRGFIVAAVVVLALAILHARNIQHQALRTGPQDYAGLAAAWRPELVDGDVVFAQRDWATTGVFYYLDIDRYRFVGRDFEGMIAREHPPRVWVLSRPGLPGLEAMVGAVRGFTTVKSLRASDLMVDLYERR